jgi:hypothetical protein
MKKRGETEKNVASHSSNEMNLGLRYNIMHLFSIGLVETSFPKIWLS